MTDNILRPFGSTPSPPKQPYVAYGLVKPSKSLVRLNIHREDDSVFFVEDANLFDVVSTDETICSLIYDKSIVQIKGRHLAPLVELLKHYEICFVECFNPHIHAEPAEHEPFIDRIQCRTALHDGNRFILPEIYHQSITLVCME